MSKSQSKFAEVPQKRKDITARRREESGGLRKQSYWSIRQSDELIAKTHDTIDRTRKRLRAAGIIPQEPKPEPQPDPFLAWGELVINGTGNRKRRASDLVINSNGYPKRRADD